MTDAAYRFYPWVRRGAAAYLSLPDVPTSVGARSSVPASVVFNADPALTATAQLELLGPADIVGFDARAIARSTPPPHSVDAEANYFAAVELVEADLPWRFTPRAEVAATSRLRPWMCLLVCRDSPEELGPFVAGRKGGLESVTLQPGTPMPPPDQLWAWCHTQVSGVDALPLDELLHRHPERCVARILSPRRLEPRTAYWALLVPVFEVGRLAGLRRELLSATGSLAAAWDATTLAATLELPVYHRWRFATGPAGDFEALARRLTPLALPATAGARPLDVSAPGGGLPAAAVEPMPLGGALQAPGAPTPAAPDPAFVETLTDLVNLPAELLAAGGAAVLAPPLYGSWHARRDQLDASAPPWFRELNDDPRLRIAASLGTEVVQTLQHELMASAWAQVDGIREANAQLRAMQLARAASARLHRRYVAAATEQTVLVLTAAVHSHLRPGTHTVRHRVDHSPVRHALVSGAMRRLSRPLGPLGRRQARPDALPAPVVGRVNDGTYASALPPTPGPLANGVPVESWLVTTLGDQLPTGTDVATAPPAPEKLAWDPVVGPPIDDWERGTSGDSPSMAAFRTAAIKFANRNRAPGPGGELHRLDVPTLVSHIVSAVDPRAAIAAALGTRFTPAPGFVWAPPDPLEPVMAHPVFSRPMYEPLAAISPDWILPGLGGVPTDSVTLAETNAAFIEAYLVGLNHEMCRELLWHEYPSDQRGSYFRQFWDPAGLAPVPVPETAKDVTPLHGWTSQLGAHSPRPAPAGGQHLMLVVRGELLRRYPSTLVYAQAATRTATGYELGTERRQPDLAGRLAPDVAFFGFSLTAEQVRGSGTAAAPGWFFVFEEQPHEPRFGLDEAQFGGPAPASWSDLAWSHLAPDETALAALTYIDLSVVHADIRALETPGNPAWHLSAAGPGLPFARGADHAVITSQQPVRVALHAAQLLP